MSAAVGFATYGRQPAFAGTPFVFEIDLNSLTAEGEMWVHSRWIVAPGLRLKCVPAVGETVLAKDEWDGYWLARVAKVEPDGFLRLVVDTSGPLPHATISFARSPR